MFSGYFLNVKLPVKHAVAMTLQQAASPERLQRAMRYRKTNDQIRCLLAESVLQQALQQRGVTDANQHIQSARFGKPILITHKTTNDPHHFNVSHSGEWVVCAVDNEPVGIDIEQRVDISDLEYDGLFTAQEMEYLEQGQPDLQLHRFYRLWTLKESYLKALGTGLYKSMQSFTIIVSDEHRARLSIAGHLQKDWYFYSFEPDAFHVCSICARQPIRTEQFHFDCIE